MATKHADRIARTGSATTPTRKIVVYTGSGKNEIREVLTTPITKIEWGLQFRYGAAHTPVEQYAFQVGKTVYERFADATAAVLKRHHVKLPVLGTHQIYVRRALDILAGVDELRVLAELPDTAREAAGAITRVA